MKLSRTHAFLACYRVTGSITRASAAAKVDRCTHYKRLCSDPEYAEAYAAAHTEWKALAAARALDRVAQQEVDIEIAEDELYKRAVYGWQEPLTFQGRLSYEAKVDAAGVPILDAEGRRQRGEPITVNKRSDENLRFYLKSARPEKYRERHEIVGKDGAPIDTKIEIVFVWPAALPAPE